jgi:hypothetical protein
MSQADTRPPVKGWHGPNRPYDLLKEATVIVVAVAFLAVVLAVVFGSPRREAVSFQQWANDAPDDLVATAVSELDGSSGTAGYGPPYNNTSGAAQQLVGITPAEITGVSQPIDTAEDLVLGPLSRLAPAGSDLATAIDTYRAASADQQSNWTAKYGKELPNFAMNGDRVTVPAGDYGPVDTMMGSLSSYARAGSFNAALLDERAGHPGFYVLDNTRSLMFLSDGTYFGGLADDAGLAGDSWGAMNTIGNWPGQWWLAVFSVWYQFSPGTTSGNADLLIATLMAVLSAIVVFLPFIPGLRSIPYRLKLYKVIWRDFYDSSTSPPHPPGD